MFLHVSVILSTGRGVSRQGDPPDQADHLGKEEPPWQGDPPDQADPPWQGEPPGRETPQTRQTPRTRQTPQAGRTPLVGRPSGSARPPLGRETPQQGDPSSWEDTPLGQAGRTPPGSRLQNTVYEWLVHILLECILVNCVCHSVHGGLCMMSLPVWLPGPMFLLGGLCPWSHVPLMGVSVQEGLCPGGKVFVQRRVSVGRHLQIRKLSSVHPTGMLSCFTYNVRVMMLSYFVVKTI